MGVNDRVGCRYKGSMAKDKQGSEHGKQEDEVTDGDDIVTMKTHKKNCNGSFCM